MQFRNLCLGVQVNTDISYSGASNFESWLVTDCTDFEKILSPGI
jgi:hypothetical protein